MLPARDHSVFAQHLAAPAARFFEHVSHLLGHICEFPKISQLISQLLLFADPISSPSFLFFFSFAGHELIEKRIITQ